ncbi:glycosyltransferase [Helicobacter sp. MIT 14-3879]|uniref:glycosyltransferase n=1 Tax=Helicobacter sp. MIT 14-3879 TaxID=2040649 RepID=UPI000E1E9BD1|nr:glycosyltransferase [Helicobacter sp. MIT 14-3879]RDU65474.1 hypothetical protein CQA44_00325 [Helicobacter sp. MIT 14-3879]
MNFKLRIKLFLKSLFNIVFKNKTFKNSILRFFGRDYELSKDELESLFSKPIPLDSKKGDFIVSLTTFPQRIHILKYTLHSIFMQNLIPKKVILSLSLEEFIDKKLPNEIMEFSKFGLEILWNDNNLRQYNKIIPVLKAYPNEVIVTLDDDIYYPQNLLKGLYNSYLSNKNVIWVQRGRILTYSSNKIDTFFNWKLVKKHNKKYQNKPLFNIFLEGVGGVLYPPNSLHRDVLDEDKFLTLSPKADDVWLWAMAVLNKSKICVVSQNLMANGNAMIISPYEKSLWLDNLTFGNDIQLSNILKAYPKILDILNQVDYLRILQLGKFYPPDLGGIESVIEDITISLRKRGLHNDCLCSNSKLYYKEEILSCGAKIMRCASFGKVASTSISPQMIFKLRSIINNYDIIHIHLPDPMANIALLLSNYKHKKIILHWHSDIIRQKRLLKLYLPFQYKLLKYSDAIIATSEKYIEESSFLPLFKDKCFAIPIGFDKSILLNSFKNHTSPFPSNKKIIFSLGRFAKNKGFEYLIQSAEFLSDDYLIFIGGGGSEPLKKNFLDLIKRKNLENKVFLIGKIERANLAEYYKNCHIFILPSLQESYGIVLVEAMSFKKPIICTRLKPSGIDFINEDNVSGIVVESHNPKAIADAISMIDKNYDYFAKNAYDRYLKHFTQKKMIDKIINLYNDIYKKG